MNSQRLDTIKIFLIFILAIIMLTLVIVGLLTQMPPNELETINAFFNKLFN